MAWYDKDDSDMEKSMHQMGAPIQQGAQNLGNALDAKMQALHKLSRGSAAGPGLQPQQTQQMQVQPPPPPEMGGSTGGPTQMGTLDVMAAQRQKILDMYNAASQEQQHANQPDEDMSGYQDVKPFQNLKSKIQDPDEDDENNGRNTRGSTKDTGTLGGI